MVVLEEWPDRVDATEMMALILIMAITASRRIVTTAAAVLGAYLTIVRITTSSGPRHRKELVPSRCLARTGCANGKSLPRRCRWAAGRWSPAPAASASRSTRSPRRLVAAVQTPARRRPHATVPSRKTTDFRVIINSNLTRWPPEVIILVRPASATALPHQTPTSSSIRRIP